MRRASSVVTVSLRSFAFFAFALASCSNDGAHTDSAPTSPTGTATSCAAVDLGEASDLFSSGRVIPNGGLVKLQGITNPKSLIWKDSTTGRIYYVAKIMGTGERLLYTEEIPLGAEPRILSEFEGTIHLWSSLPSEDAGPMAKALEKEWGVRIVPERTYLIRGGAKPQGCR